MKEDEEESKEGGEEAEEECEEDEALKGDYEDVILVWYGLFNGHEYLFNLMSTSFFLAFF